MISISKLSLMIGIYRTAITSRLERLNIRHIGRDLDDKDLDRYFKAEKAFRNKKLRRLKNEAAAINQRIEKEEAVLSRIEAY